MGEIVRLGLTGGPCSGKSTALGYLQEKFLDAGCNVLVISETATELFRSGLKIGRGGLDLFTFQRFLIQYQIARENYYSQMARCYKGKTFVVADRGVADCRAYMPPGSYEAVLDSINLNPFKVFARYEGIFHLVTAAVGAREFYTRENNPYRKETPRQASALDLKTRLAWVGHPHLRIFPNLDQNGARISFEKKLKRLREAACRLLGFPVPIEDERKFLISAENWIGRGLNKFPPFGKIHGVKSEIEQIYLVSPPEVERRIRKRGQGGQFIYYWTKKRNLGQKERPETEKQIDALEFFELTQEADPEFDVIKKDRFCFISDDQYFELDFFREPKRLAGKSILEIELTETNDKVTLPPFLKVIKEVTGDPKFYNRELARKK